jgi:hypothetical protein
MRVTLGLPCRYKSTRVTPTTPAAWPRLSARDDPDLERGADGALSVVAVGERHAEHRHDAVANVLVDCAAVQLDGPIDAIEEAAEQGVDLFGVELASDPAADCPVSRPASAPSAAAPCRMTSALSDAKHVSGRSREM